MKPITTIEKAESNRNTSRVKRWYFGLDYDPPQSQFIGFEFGVEY